MGEYTKEGLKLKDMISYQDGAIVSKTLINQSSGTVTLFAFDKGQALSEHTAPFDAFVYVIDGEAQISIDGKAFHVKSDEMIVIPANRPHALNAVTRFKMMLTMIKGA